MDFAISQARSVASSRLSGKKSSGGSKSSGGNVCFLFAKVNDRIRFQRLQLLTEMTLGNCIDPSAYVS